MDRYQRVEKPRGEAPINENEIRVTSQGRTRNYITYATSLFEDRGSSEIIIKAMGRAISKSVMIVELLKRRIASLHQITKIESTDVTDMWEPLEEGLHTLETTRHVSMITIILSKNELDTLSLGYQPPIPTNQVKPLSENDYNGEPMPRNRGGRRGGRGRVRGRGYGNGMVGYDEDEGWEGGNRVRGRGRGRSRGRGYQGSYGNGDMQQEIVGYEDGVQDGFPPQGHEGRSRRGRGRGRGRVNGRGDGALSKDAS